MRNIALMENAGTCLHKESRLYPDTSSYTQGVMLYRPYIFVWSVLSSVHIFIVRTLALNTGKRCKQTNSKTRRTTFDHRSVDSRSSPHPTTPNHQQRYSVLLLLRRCINQPLVSSHPLFNPPPSQRQTKPNKN